MKRWIGILITVFAAAPRVSADPSKARLTTDKPVYKVGSSESVVITLKNQGNAQMLGGSVFVSKDGQLIWQSSFDIEVVELAPGQSKSWNWPKKDNSGNPVGPGSYTIEIDPIGFESPDPTFFSKKLTIALTPSGSVAGTSRFPLYVGNEWKFRKADGGTSTTKVSAKDGGWYQVQYLTGANRWARLAGSALWVKSTFYSSAMFKFGRPLGYTYLALVPDLWLFQVAAVNETVSTPGGTFKNCYRLWSSAGSFTFAPGIGLVKYTSGGGTFLLARAEVRGTDGAFYTVGVPD